MLGNDQANYESGYAPDATGDETSQHTDPEVISEGALVEERESGLG
jgi:hypothetical protein